MNKHLMLFCAALLSITFAFADKGKDSLEIAQEKMWQYVDSVSAAMKYQTGSVALPNGIATLTVPAGFKYLNKEQSNFIITKVWGNPPQEGVLGMLFPQNADPYSDSSYAFVISFNEIGFVKDEDANEIDYDEMLKQLQSEELEENELRKKEGYEPIHMVGWAQKPFYDKERKVLHWAKELRFGEDAEEHTLNYDIRFLGRKGVLSFNAVSGMGQMNLVKQDISKVLTISNFTAGNKYSDFKPDVDHIAAYTIGGLVAGKVLMKVGFWALILKFWKLIAGGCVALWYGIKKFFIKKKQNEAYTEPTDTIEPVA